jgi:uncharacterized protein YggT (Ycf19 family)
MRNYEIANFLNWLVSIVFSIIGLSLLLRFLFRLFGASTQAPIVQFLYTSTEPLLAPFQGIFPVQPIEPGGVFEFPTLIAIVIYALLAWLIMELIDLITYNARRTYRRT